MATLVPVENRCERLIKSSKKASYDPFFEVDFTIKEEDADLFGLPPEWSCLYGTKAWSDMTHEQRVLFTRHEAASIMHVGIWFEMILQQMLIREQYLGKYDSNTFKFSLVEIADECRHSLMFAEAGTVMSGGVTYHPGRVVGNLGNLMKTVAHGTPAYVGILIGEYLLDIMQRDGMIDNRVLPMVRGVSNIHVIEESRHMAFAKEEIKELSKGLNIAQRHSVAIACAIIGNLIMRQLVQPEVFTNAGLPEEYRKQALNNKQYKELLKEKSAPLMRFIEDAGLMNPVARKIYEDGNML